MLEVTQTRTVQWEREASELSDSEMVFIAEAMLAAPSVWHELKTGDIRTETISYNERSLWVTFVCANAEGDIYVRLLHVQELDRRE